MPRTYKRIPGKRRYRDYTEGRLQEAVDDVKNNGTSLRRAATKFGVPFRTIKNKLDGKHTQPVGKPTIFTSCEEAALVRIIITCSEWGQPLDLLDIRMIAKRILEQTGRSVPVLRNNTPGLDWAYSFLKRHEQDISLRFAQNIKRGRAEISAETVIQYFDHLNESLKHVQPHLIINYDETNLSDDPGKKRCIFKRGVKYPERIMNYSKGSTSIMFAGTASGKMLPLYTVYKAEHLWDNWIHGGPENARYNRSKSGWFDQVCFNDWLKLLLCPTAEDSTVPKFSLGTISALTLMSKFYRNVRSKIFGLCFCLETARI